MTQPVPTLLGFLLLVLLLLLRVPVGFAMAIAGATGFGMIVGAGPALNILGQVTYNTLTSYEFSIIPMFILMGVFSARGELSLELFRSARVWIGHYRGGLGIATLLAAGGFAAINGSSIATASTMTRVALPEMENNGYAPSVSAGIIAAGGTLGIMIPPSAVLAVYGFITEQDIGALFTAGILPGLLGIGMYWIVVMIISRLKPEGMVAAPKAPWRERWLSLRQIWAVLLLFSLVIGGIYGGIFTVTEAAGVGAAGAAIISALRGKLNVRQTIECLGEALRMSSAIFMLVIGALVFGYFLTVTGTTPALIGWITAQDLSPYVILTLILIFYLILGAIMDELAMTLLTLPVVYPVIVALGFDPIWFGIIFVMVVTLGLITPPIGMNVFVINAIAPHIGLRKIYAGVMPFIASDLVRLVLLILFPSISLVLSR